MTARVLHVDDDPALAVLVQRSLRQRGYEVEHVLSVDAGLSRIREGGIDVVALDHSLSTGTGLDLLRAVRAIADAPPVVYVTEVADTQVAVASLKAGATYYVIKTVDQQFVELLGTAIDQAIDKANLQREKERAEQEVRAARDRAELLLHEVNHRVANSLALVAALVGLQARSVSEPSVRDVLGQVQKRISAIAGVHRNLNTSQDMSSVEISEYLASLLQDLESTLRQAGHASQVRLIADQTDIPTNKAVSIGVIVSELVTNAFKYAYPDRQNGEIRVLLERLTAGNIKLTVEDDGVGWRGDGPVKGTGMGSRIISAMARGLGSSVAYGNDAAGCRVYLEFPI
jgi:two-component sensor histidine kinase